MLRFFQLALDMAAHINSASLRLTRRLILIPHDPIFTLPSLAFYKLASRAVQIVSMECCTLIS
jgi:hypothetical protein